MGQRERVRLTPDEASAFAIPDLPAGQYTVEVGWLVRRQIGSLEVVEGGEDIAVSVIGWGTGARSLCGPDAKGVLLSVQNAETIRVDVDGDVEVYPVVDGVAFVGTTGCSDGHEFRFASEVTLEVHGTSGGSFVSVDVVPMSLPLVDVCDVLKGCGEEVLGPDLPAGPVKCD